MSDMESLNVNEEEQSNRNIYGELVKYLGSNEPVEIAFSHEGNHKGSFQVVSVVGNEEDFGETLVRLSDPDKLLTMGDENYIDLKLNEINLVDEVVRVRDGQEFAPYKAWYGPDEEKPRTL